MMDADVIKAEMIRASRGNSEAEVSCTGEAGLHQCLLRCKKNPGHGNFIPRNNFNIEHLPPCYRESVVVDYVRATSDISCRVSVSRISEGRPETWPDSDEPFPFSAHKGQNSMTVGTGWMSSVVKFTEKNNMSCDCEKCGKPGSHTPKKTWGKVLIYTACHVVFNSDEAKHTKCQFFYDSPETNIKNVLTLTGLKVVRSDIKGDLCEMEYITHDVELLDRFYKMYKHWEDQRYKLLDKFVSNEYPSVECHTNVPQALCIVVSHPHGCTKEISVGFRTHRQVVNKNVWGYENIIYGYNTPTCPGSSGAAIITLYKDNTWSHVIHRHPPHSQGRLGNDNNSGFGWETV